MAAILDRQSRYPSVRGMGCAMSTTSFESPHPGLHSSLSQPAECAGTHYESRTLPRQRRNRLVPTASVGGATAHHPSSARRQMVCSRVADYLKSLNSMTRSIVLETEIVEERHAGEWPAMDETLQEEVVDEHFMPPDVHAHYGTLPRSSRRGSPVSRSSRNGDFESQSTTDHHRTQQQQHPAPDSTHTSPQHSSSPTYFIPPTHNRLHKNQLSYRSKALRKVMNIPLPANSAQYQNQKRDSGLGSDGESPRTSDEDMLHNPLGFQRNNLRSFSLRQRRGGSRNPNSLSRSSTRRMHRVVAGDESRGGSAIHRSARCPGQYDNGYDAEVDLPDDSLLNDHISPHQPESVGTRSPPKPPRYSSRARRSLRMQPRVLADKFSTEEEEEEENEEAVVIPNTHSRVASNSSDSTAGSSVNRFDTTLPVFHNRPAIVLTNLRRAHSEDSIDTDTDSIAPSNLSILSKSTDVLTEDEAQSDATMIRTCITPDSFLTVGSSAESSAQSKKGGLVRSRPQSMRGGSFYETSTSEFANRRAQFKPNMLRNQLSAQNSPTNTRQSTPCHTRQSTPSFSRQSTPSFSRQNTPSFSRQNTPSLSSDTKNRDHYLSKPILKSPTPSSLTIKQRVRSASESGTGSDPATSPEFLSQFSNPAHTPEVKSIMRGGGVSDHLTVQSGNRESERESGYISSSSESFAFASRR